MSFSRTCCSLESKEVGGGGLTASVHDDPIGMVDSDTRWGGSGHRLWSRRGLWGSQRTETPRGSERGTRGSPGPVDRWWTPTVALFTVVGKSGSSCDLWCLSKEGVHWRPKGVGTLPFCAAAKVEGTTEVVVNDELMSSGYCDRTPLNKQGFVSQDPTGGFSMKRECANTHISIQYHDIQVIKQLLHIKCRVLWFTKYEAQKMLQQIYQSFYESDVSHDKRTLFALEESGHSQSTYTCESQ
jgi:hypothetical protein